MSMPGFCAEASLLKQSRYGATAKRDSRNGHRGSKNSVLPQIPVWMGSVCDDSTCDGGTETQCYKYLCDFSYPFNCAYGDSFREGCPDGAHF